MDITQVEKLAKIMQEIGLTTISIKEGDTEILLEKHCAPTLPAPLSMPGIAPMTVLSEAASDAAAGKTQTAPAADEGHAVLSPTVGMFYSAASPDSEPFVQIGAKVEKGDVLCIIEAMKLMNEITSDFSGTIAEICVGNGQIIEYGQPLFRIV